MGEGDAAYEKEFGRWVAPFLDAFGHKVRRRWAPVYLRGLLAPGDRKSVEPLAARVAPDDFEQVHHFVWLRPRLRTPDIQRRRRLPVPAEGPIPDNQGCSSGCPGTGKAGSEDGRDRDRSGEETRDSSGG